MGHIYPEMLKENISRATAISEFVKTSFGPKGMNKLLFSKDKDTIVTSDGGTILKEIDTQHPAAQVMCEIAHAMKGEVGDGTLTAVILAGSLLKEAEDLINRGIHPTTIIRGYNQAMKKALSSLEGIADSSTTTNTAELAANVARTTIRGKIGASIEEKIAEIITHAIIEISQTPGRKPDLNDIKIDKIVGGSVADSVLVKGLVLKGQAVHSEMPETVENARILLVMCPMEILSMVQYSKWFAYPTGKVGINITKPTQIKQFLNAEKRTLRKIIENIVRVGANTIFCFRGIDEYVSNQLAKKGILALRRVARKDMERLSKSTGGKFVSNWEEVTTNILGEAKRIHIEKKGKESFTFIEGCSNPQALSIVIQGGTKTFVEEAERVIHNGLCSTREAIVDRRIVMGGGSFEMELANNMHKFAEQQIGRIRLAIHAFAKALESIPKTLAQNAAVNPIDIITELRMKHAQGEKGAGIDVDKGKVANMLTKGVFEPARVKIQALKSATEATMTILRVDTIITKTPKKTEEKEGDTSNENQV